MQTSVIYTLSLHDALPILAQRRGYGISEVPINWEHRAGSRVNLVLDSLRMARDLLVMRGNALDRKSTRLNSSHVAISYAVFCLKKKKKRNKRSMTTINNIV